VYRYPFKINEQAEYTQHQLTLYFKSNYCKTDQEVQEQPSVTGGNEQFDIVLFDI
jgi:hypothetical protein